MPPELRQCAATRQAVPERRYLRHMARFGEKDAFAGWGAQNGRVKDDLAAPIDRCDDRLRGDIKPIEAAATRRRHTRADHSAQGTAFRHGYGRWRCRHPYRWLLGCR